MKELLGLVEPTETLCPVAATSEELETMQTSDWTALAKKIQEAYRTVSQGKDVVLIEGLGGSGKKTIGRALLADILNTAGAGLVVVLQYADKTLEAELDDVRSDLQANMVGLVVNAVPANRMASKEEFESEFDVAVFGVLPQDRTLMAISVMELKEALDAEMIGSGNWNSALVEHLMVGAMSLDSGTLYFGRKSNKAAVIRGDRPDMQLAALETPTKCLILTGGVRPIDAVMRQADERNVPIMVVSDDTQITLSRIERAVQTTRFYHAKKQKRFDEILAEHFDFEAFYQRAGL
jgi:hypothetical protein